jgi:hypothetical protein
MYHTDTFVGFSYSRDFTDMKLCKYIERRSIDSQCKFDLLPMGNIVFIVSRERLAKNKPFNELNGHYYARCKSALIQR